MFDPNGPTPIDSGLFGLPYSLHDASLVVIPVPWDATSSQVTTSASAPSSIYDASKFVELYDPKRGAIYERGIALDTTDMGFDHLCVEAKTKLSQHIVDKSEIDKLCGKLNDRVECRVLQHLVNGKSVGLVGGDHSISFGGIAACIQQYPGLGVLQIDAHSDLRCAYDGLIFSHASVMYNALESLGVKSLTQVGVRGVCEFEADYSAQSDRVSVYYDYDIKSAVCNGKRWIEVCDEIVSGLPADIYLTIDIDGLDPGFCAHTGTPIPGGLSYFELLMLLERIDNSGKRIVAFDLVEVSSNAIDANNAAHLLYQLCAFAN